MLTNCKKWYICMEHLSSLYRLFPSLPNYYAFFEDRSWNTNTQNFVIGRSFNHSIPVLAFTLIQEIVSMGTTP